MGKLVLREYADRYKKEVIKLNKDAISASEIASKSWNPQWEGELHKIRSVYIGNGGAFLLAFKLDKLVGMGGLLRVDGATAKVKWVRVHPDCQKQGVAMLIIGALEKKARSLGYKRLVADAVRGNAAAEGMLMKSGFKSNGGKTFDGVVFLRKLFGKKLASFEKKLG